MAAHRDYLLSCVTELPAFSQHMLDALDLSLCEDIVATVDLPRFDNSAMDGYAARAVDVADASRTARSVCPSSGRSRPGAAPPHRLSPGTAMKIMTGAPVPELADTIVPYENTDRGVSDVKVTAPSEPGQHIRRVGEDIARGTQLYAEGDLLGPRDIGVLAGIGRDKVLVRPRPRVVVIATGSELVEPGSSSSSATADLRLELLPARRRGAGGRCPGLPGRPGRRRCRTAAAAGRRPAASGPICS